MTQNTTQVLLILLGGFVGGLAGSALTGGGTTTPEIMITADAGDLGGEALSTELANRLLRVEGSMIEMSEALGDMRSQMADRRREPLPPESGNARGGEGHRNSRGDSANLGPEGELEDRFSSFLDQREEQEAEERREQEAERRAQRVERRIERYAERLNLNDYQSQEMGRIMTAADEKRTAYFVELRESGGGVDHTAMREAMQEMSAGTNDELAQLLDSDQMADYEAMQSEGRGGWGGWSGGRGGGRGGNDRGGNNNEF